MAAGSDLDRMWAYEDLINARLAADKTPDFNHGWSKAIDYVTANPDVVLRALGYESFLYHGQQHNNDSASSRCYPGCGQAWRNPKELIQ